MDGQLLLFPDMSVKIKIANKECVDITDIDVRFTGGKEMHRKSNLMVDKLKALPKGRYFCFKEGKNGFPYVQNIKTGKILSINFSRNQYPCVSVGGVAIACHRLFALAFIENDDPSNKLEVDHIDEDKVNYRLPNLNWMTCSRHSRKSRRK